MGAYTDRLNKRFNKKIKHRTASNGSRLVSCAIIRNGMVHGGRFHKSHYSIRRELGDEFPLKPLPGDQDGFMTSENQFVTRDQAKPIAVAAGQCQPMMRELLSSDIDRW